MGRYPNPTIPLYIMELHGITTFFSFYNRFFLSQQTSWKVSYKNLILSKTKRAVELCPGESTGVSSAWEWWQNNRYNTCESLSMFIIPWYFMIKHIDTIWYKHVFVCFRCSLLIYIFICVCVWPYACLCFHPHPSQLPSFFLFCPWCVAGFPCAG